MEISMWPFTKQERPLVDTLLTGIQLDENLWYPIISENNEEYINGIEKMKDILSKWIMQDIKLATDIGKPADTTMAYALRNIDLKFLPYPSHLFILIDTLSNTEYNRSGGRFFDAITVIYTEVPTEVIRTFIGKFLYAMIYGLPNEIDKQQLPSKEDWVTAMAQAPWCPFVHLVQSILDGNIDEATN